MVRTPHLLIARPAFDLQGLAIRWSAMVPATQWVVCDVALVIHGRCSVAMFPDEVVAACSTSKQKPARNSHLYHTMDALERPSARINATASRGCALASHTVDLQHSKLCFHGRCPTHITQTSPPAHTHASLNTHAHTTRTQHHTHAQHTHTPSLVGVMNGPARRG